MVLLEANREGYAVNQLDETMTIGELIDYLQSEFDEDSRIYISNDNGYTYGAITGLCFREEEDEEEEDEEEEEEEDDEDEEE